MDPTSFVAGMFDTPSSKAWLAAVEQARILIVITTQVPVDGRRPDALPYTIGASIGLVPLIAPQA